VRLAVAATPQVAIPTLEYLLTSEHELVKIFTTTDKQVGRGRSLTASEVAQWAEVHGIECIKVARASEMSAHLDDVDCVVTIAFGILLPPEVLDIPTHGFINLHFSTLPAWRGAAPVQRAIEHGDDYLGISVFKLDPGMDTGPIYNQTSFPRDPEMRSKEALEFLASQGVSLIAKTLEDISKDIDPVGQITEGSSLAKKLSKAEALIDWNLADDVIQRKIAAFYPNPIAYTNFRGETLKITRSKISHDQSLIPVPAPGQWIIEKDRVLIGTGQNPLEIVQLIPQGKSEMSATDWARGARINPGERCG
jgi:methionyl-tRNA formyltransferase